MDFNKALESFQTSFVSRAIIQKPCRHCGKMFKKIESRNYCSFECAYKWATETKGDCIEHVRPLSWKNHYYDPRYPSQLRRRWHEVFHGKKVPLLSYMAYPTCGNDQCVSITHAQIVTRREWNVYMEEKTGRKSLKPKQKDSRVKHLISSFIKQYGDKYRDHNGEMTYVLRIKEADLVETPK